MLSITFKGQRITRQTILMASQFIAPLNTNSKAQKFAVVINGEKYAPKKIMSKASGLPVSGFSGGRDLNSIFTRLEFDVVAK